MYMHQIAAIQVFVQPRQHSMAQRLIWVRLHNLHTIPRVTAQLRGSATDLLFHLLCDLCHVVPQLVHQQVAHVGMHMLHTKACR